MLFSNVRVYALPVQMLTDFAHNFARIPIPLQICGQIGGNRAAKSGFTGLHSRGLFWLFCRHYAGIMRPLAWFKGTFAAKRLTNSHYLTQIRYI